jgi:signal peptide peptidase-like protein 2B
MATHHARRLPAAAAVLLLVLLAGGSAADDASSDDDAGVPPSPGCSNKFQLVTRAPHPPRRPQSVPVFLFLILFRVWWLVVVGCLACWLAYGGDLVGKGWGSLFGCGGGDLWICCLRECWLVMAEDLENLVELFPDGL